MKSKLPVLSICALASIIPSAALLTAALLLAPPLSAQSVHHSEKSRHSLLLKCDRVLATQVTESTVTATTRRAVSAIVQCTGDWTPHHENQIRSLGGDVYRHLPLIHGAAIRIPARNLTRLAALPFVAHLSADGAVHKCDEFTVDHTGADVVYEEAGLTGDGVTVAVVDSGIAFHRDLRDNPATRSRVLARVNFSPADSVDDECGHGTHVAGIIAGNGNASRGPLCFRTFYGIARSANLVSVRVLDAQGYGTVSGVINGLDWIIRHRNRYNIRVVNLSLGHPVAESYKTDPLCQAVEAVYAKGITVVCAAGNGGRQNESVVVGDPNEGWGTSYGSIQSPANDPYVITVGGMKQDPNAPTDRSRDQIATYSARGPSRLDWVLKPDIVAPGNRIISLNVPGSFLEQNYSSTNALPRSAYRYAGTDQDSRAYCYLSGTSMAAPVVTGAVALLLEKHPNLTPDTIKARLMITADKWSGPDGTMDPCTFGAGYLNIAKALQSRVVARSAAMSPPLALSDDGQVMVDPSQVIWGGAGESKKTIWGVNELRSTQVIWGGVSDGRAVFGSQVLWGGVVNNPRPLATSDVWTDLGVSTDSNVDVDLSSVVLLGEP